MNPDKRLYLIDGHALIFKMFYAFMRRPMINSKGEDTSILFGFTKYILELMEREKPSHLAVAFDPPCKTFRHEIYPDYKGTRQATPDLVKQALDPLIEICRALNIPVLMKPGFEADDVIGSAAKKAGSEGFTVYMVTPDKDYGQLISDNIFQLKPGKAGGEDELLGVKEICDKYGISDPLQIIDMLTICGDSSDNIPGVKGVGEVGASKLISKYGSVDSIYEHVDELTPKQHDMFVQALDHIGLSKTLVTIRTDIEMDGSFESMAVDRNYGPQAAALFERHELLSLKKFLGDCAGQEVKTQTTFAYKEVTVELLKDSARKAGKCAIFAEAAGDSIFAPVKRIYAGTTDGMAAMGNPEEFKDLLEDSGTAKYGFDLKLLYNLLLGNNITLDGELLDIALMHYVLDPEKSHKPEMLSRGYLGVELEEYEATASTGSLFDDTPEKDEEDGDSMLRKSAIFALLGGKVEDELRGAGLMQLYCDIEEPLIKVLAEMERTGVKVDLASLKGFASGLAREVEERQKTIRQMTGEPGLNASSPKQVGAALFGKMKLDPKAKAKADGTYQTDEETLNSLMDKHPVVNEILEYRAAKKLLSTYIDPFPAYVSPVTGRIHTTFNQSLTATGRLSSSRPNLQNIPVRTERGKQIRAAFVSDRKDGLIMSADYSQIELRVMAHLSCDKNLIEAFQAGEDVHKVTAARIFGIGKSDVTADQRRVAKTANFGIMYGISSFGLSQRLHISRSEAKQIIDEYFLKFPAISMFIEDTLTAARENGYVETLFGRRRYIPDINARNGNVRALAERNAVNAPIQGTAADIIKIAMAKVAARMEKASLDSRMVLQIHDELLFDTTEDEVESLKALVLDEMENVIQLSIPLTVECSYGKNWLEAH